MGFQALMRVLVAATGIAGLLFCSSATASENDEKWNAAMVKGYAKDNGVSPKIAQEHLAVQRQAGNEAVEDMKKLLGDDYAGLWFDNNDGRFKVGTVPGSHEGAIAEWTQARKLQDLTDTVPVRSTWNELTEAQKDLEAELLADKDSDGRPQVALVPSSNSIEVRGLASDRQRLTKMLERSVDNLGVNIKFETISPDQLNVEPGACVYPNCDYPLQAGQSSYYSQGGGYWGRRCTLAFWARGGLFGDNPYVLSAGHCYAGGTSVYPQNTNPSGSPTLLGPADVSVNNLWGDFAAIRSSTLQWTPLWPGIWFNRAAVWGLDTNRAINNSASSFEGMFLCHTGIGEYMEADNYPIQPLDKCGTVQALNQTIPYTNPTGSLTRASGCSAPGDSGGPYIAFNSAVGIAHGGTTRCNSNAEMYYSEVNVVAGLLGLQVGGPLW